MSNPKTENRKPEEARSPGSEEMIRATLAGSALEFRISFGFRISDFGFSPCS